MGVNGALGAGMLGGIPGGYEAMWVFWVWETTNMSKVMTNV